MRKILCTLALALVVTSWPALAGELAGVTLPDQETVDGKALVLNGMGLREATFLKVDVYVAGLYLESKSGDPAAILSSGQAKRLVLRFVRSVGRDDLVKAWTEGFEKNVPDLAAVKPGLDALNAAMVDVETGDTIVLTEVPGTGVAVSVKGKAGEPIAVEGFAKALWSVWLGKTPPNPGLKEGLLGRD